LVRGVQLVGFGRFSGDATELLQALNHTEQRDMASA
jgi:hypothetical protein